MLDIIHHPEYNSTLILRAEIVSDLSEENLPSPPQRHQLHGFDLSRFIRRQLLARRPGRDPSMFQTCVFYRQCDLDQEHDPEVSSICILTPELSAEEPLPYYHPKVSHLAFRYTESATGPAIRIEVCAMSGEPIPRPVDPTSRLYRTCLSLLETLHRYGLGKLSNYQKRVLHDCIVPREIYQDVYLVMRERYKHLVNTWQESTDPLKHVYEDISIATYLILLWKDTFPAVSSDSTDSSILPSGRLGESWGSPPGGFVDIGCGNGLLVHILLSEGYHGLGFDVRSRASWDHYPDSTRCRLLVHTFDPAHLSPAYLEQSAARRIFPVAAFIIANHADELTPWTPLISLVTSASGYLSIPCCAWSFDRKFTREQRDGPSFPKELIPKLNLGHEGTGSSYAQYRIWLAAVSLGCGWSVECDTLRIPSTRNWAILGRKREEESGQVTPQDFCNNIMLEVERRGVWTGRKPEGKRGHD